MAAASLLLGACASTGTDATSGSSRTASSSSAYPPGTTSGTPGSTSGDGATSIAMQAGGATPSANMQVSLGEDTATLTDGASTVNCKARQ